MGPSLPAPHQEQRTCPEMTLNYHQQGAGGGTWNTLPHPEETNNLRSRVAPLETTLSRDRSGVASLEPWPEMGESPEAPPPEQMSPRRHETSWSLPAPQNPISLTKARFRVGEGSVTLTAAGADQEAPDRAGRENRAGYQRPLPYFSATCSPPGCTPESPGHAQRGRKDSEQ